MMQQTTKRIEVGFWAPISPLVSFLETIASPSPYPDVRTMVHSEWDLIERARVIRYLKRGAPCASWMGYSTCRLCGRSNGHRDFTDGVYLWPEGFAHYLEVHDVKPPDAFIQHVLKNNEQPQTSPA